MNTVLVILAVVLGAAAMVALGGNVAATIDGLVSLAAGPSPYFISGHAALLYIWTPLVVLAASALFLAPGLVIALGAGSRTERFELWLLKGFTISVFGVPAAAAFVNALTGLAMTGSGFVLLLVLLCLPGLLLVARRGAAPVLRGRTVDLAVMAVLPFAVLVLMAPKFYWENFNDDGAHSFLSALLFIARGIPFWPPGDSALIGYPSTTMMTETFVQTGFLRFFGPYESALRFAYLPGLAVLAGTFLGFMRDRDGRTPVAVGIGLGAQLLLFSFVMAFNPTYNSYFADIAMPMTREPLIMIGFTGAVLFYRERRYVWMGAVASLALLSAPNGLLLIGFFLLASLALTRPVPLGQVIVAGAIAVGIVALATVAMILLDHLGIAVRGNEFGSDGILRRLRFVTLDDTQRLLFWLLPAGILPGLSMLAWRSQDHLSRCLTLTAVVYLLFFYVQAYRILPHHFAPAALLSVIVFWRLRPVAAAPGRALAASLAGVIASGLVSWPPTMKPNLANRDFGRRVAIDAPADVFRDPAALTAYATLVSAGFPPAWTDAQARSAHAPETTASFVYATLLRGNGAQPDYAIQPEGAPRPAGAELIGSAVDGMVLLSLNAAALARDRDPSGRPVSIAPVFKVPRESIFGHGLNDRRRKIWDLAAIVGIR